jgi:hypothetical protein
MFKLYVYLVEISTCDRTGIVKYENRIIIISINVSQSSNTNIL